MTVAVRREACTHDEWLPKSFNTAEGSWNGQLKPKPLFKALDERQEAFEASGRLEDGVMMPYRAVVEK